MTSSGDNIARRLASESARDRLEAARYLADNAKSKDAAIIRAALAKERVSWVRTALSRALNRVSPSDIEASVLPSLDHDDVPESIAAQVHAEALETTTAQLIHELEPLIGSLRLAAEREIDGFEGSDTAARISRIDEFLEALARLRRAASAPKLSEFLLDQLIDECVADVSKTSAVKINKIGQEHLLVTGDKTLISMSLTNGLRNAIEATALLDEDELNDTAVPDRPVTVAWGSTDRDNWVSIVDMGIGFAGNLQRAFDIGTTTKEGHMGMGLAIARQSMASMNGQAILAPSEKGVRFECRWPASLGS